jgi:hypothetical protein
MPNGSERVDGDCIAAIFDEAFREINLQVSVHCVERSRLTAKVSHPTLPYPTDPDYLSPIPLARTRTRMLLPLCSL